MYTSVHDCCWEYTGDMEHEPAERTTRDVRGHLADVINDAIRGRVTYITSNGRRVAAIVPLAITDTIQAQP